MATGSITFDPPPIPLASVATQIVVAKYDRTKSSGSRYSLMPNLRCERIVNRDGMKPSSAQFSYVLDSSDPTSPFPFRAESLWPLGIVNPYVANLGDELVVFALDAKGNPNILFDGFADAPQINIDGNSQSVTFAASGVAIRCWDAPIGGAFQRDAEYPNAAGFATTDLRVRFNPDGKPNATPLGYDVNEGASNAYPVFLDWRLNRLPEVRRFWTLGMFARYLLQNRPSGTSGDLAYVDNPASAFLSGLDRDLQALTPTSGAGGTIDVSDPTSYTATDIIIDDVLACERPWPDVLAQTLSRYGFNCRFVLGQTTAAAPALPEPTNILDLYRQDGLFEAPPKNLLLQSGGTLNPGASNVTALTLVRDAKNCANDITVVPRNTRYEVGIILAPGFEIDAADAASTAAMDQFKLPALANASAATRAKYRKFVADETGEGHWDLNLAYFTTTVLDLKPIFGKVVDTVDGVYTRFFCSRRRPAEDTLFASKGDNKAFRAEVAISTDYTGPCPGVWDGQAGTWQSIGHNGWKMLDDCLGIEISVENPNAVKLPDVPAGSTQVIPGGVLRIIESLAAPDSQKPRFFFKLTCVIEGDHGFSKGVAPRRAAASPVPFTIRRRIDARDIYEEDDLTTSSFHYLGPVPFTRDDSAKAIALAESKRAEAEFPSVLGSVTMAGVIQTFAIGDQISGISGRRIDFRMNAGASAKESPQYPVVASVQYDFTGGKQFTKLELSAPLRE